MALAGSLGPVRVDGIDGGAQGAAVRLEAAPGRPRAVAVAVWTVDEDRATVTGSVRGDDGRWIARTAEVAAPVIGLAAARLCGLSGPAWALVVEDAHVGIDPRASISVARAGGVALAGWSAAWDRAAPVRLVGPDAWRRGCGIPNRRDQRKVLAARMVPQLVDFDGVGELTEHAVDAAGIALCGLLLEAWGPRARWLQRVGGRARSRAVRR